MKIVATLIACAMLCTGCVKRDVVVPDRTIPHRIAEEAEVRIIVRKGDQTVVETARFPAGAWIAWPDLLDD